MGEGDAVMGSVKSIRLHWVGGDHAVIGSSESVGRLSHFIDTLYMKDFGDLIQVFQVAINRFSCVCGGEHIVVLRFTPTIEIPLVGVENNLVTHLCY